MYKFNQHAFLIVYKYLGGTFQLSITSFAPATLFSYGVKGASEVALSHREKMGRKPQKLSISIWAALVIMRNARQYL